jgi:putative Mn2+ efflux pump MntP
MTVLVFKVVQLITILAGAQLGYLGLSKIKVPKLNFIPGIIMIFLGLKQLFLSI